MIKMELEIAISLAQDSGLKSIFFFLNKGARAMVLSKKPRCAHGFSGNEGQCQPQLNAHCEMPWDPAVWLADLHSRGSESRPFVLSHFWCPSSEKPNGTR